ncbi:MAG TPA: PilZ domain-containing protein [Terriglobales bacterium]|nr:PilZ domain-containing protein [Terriglobales bacterium]
MSDSKANVIPGADWTRLLTDPDLVEHLGSLLQTYREAAPEKREEALLKAMREIKAEGGGTTATPAASAAAAAPMPSPTPVTAAETPPFEPSTYLPSWVEDRRRFPRIKCFVAVELKVDGAETPVWGNLANTSMGGCYVETVAPVKSGSDVQIGLWVANGKVWIKGFILNGIVIKSNPCFGVRIKFDVDGAARDSLRQFIKHVETTTKAQKSEYSYLQKLQK